MERTKYVERARRGGLTIWKIASVQELSRSVQDNLWNKIITAASGFQRALNLRLLLLMMMAMI